MRLGPASFPLRAKATSFPALDGAAKSRTLSKTLVKQVLRTSFHPLRQAAAVFFQQKCSDSEALADDALGFGVAGRSGDPLLANAVLSGGKPFLWQHFHEGRLQVDDKQSKCWIVV